MMIIKFKLFLKVVRRRKNTTNYFTFPQPFQNEINPNSTDLNFKINYQNWLQIQTNRASVFLC